MCVARMCIGHAHHDDAALIMPIVLARAGLAAESNDYFPARYVDHI